MTGAVSWPADRVERWPLAKLVPYARNARTHTPDQVKQIAASMKEWGWTIPVLADEKGGIIAGHARVMAAALNQYTEAPVMIACGWSDAKKRAYVLADNKLALNAGWDDTILAAELSDLKALAYDIPLTGFTCAEVSDLLSLSDDPADDACPGVPEQATTIEGDLWLLGNHRLLCGDATCREDVERVMAGVQVGMVFTDPPYGINTVRAGSIGGDKPFGKNGFDGIIKAGIYAPIIGDDSIETALTAYAVCKAIGVPVILLWGGNFYAHKLPPARCWVIWDKETDGNFGDGEIAWCNADKSIRIFRHKWSGMLKASERGERRVHPTQKPVALAVWAFGEFIPSSAIVFDPFLGSGSTLIACEKTSRTCLGMELSPAYCDVIIKRWQTFTGRQATREGDGRLFNELAGMERMRA